MATAQQYRKWLMLSALVWALLGCFQGLAISGFENKKMGKAAYHLVRHFSELLLGCALAFPYTSLSATKQKIAFVCLQIAPLSNFASYMIIAITNCPNPLFANSPELVAPGSGEGNIWTALSTFGLQGVTAFVTVVGLGLLIYGVAEADPEVGEQAAEVVAAPKRGKTPMKKSK
ncbi:unnamed protein product [Amoebophrya sp. A25]|nr:unnamed protein product [Amoebophrya sp. A25]|eukprot:GSA25T00014614001.1